MNYRGNPTQVTTYLTPGTPTNGISKNFTYRLNVKEFSVGQSELDAFHVERGGFTVQFRC